MENIGIFCTDLSHVTYMTATGTVIKQPSGI